MTSLPSREGESFQTVRQFSSGVTLIYASTIFISAFLLFQVQPIIAKIILPWFGGAAAVWSVCLLFFQTVLLIGYLYAHFLTQNFRPRVQAWIHAVLLAASFLVLPILPRGHWRPSGTADPAFRVLLVLAVTVGLPYFLLSSTSPLLQAWQTRARRGAIPYRLYALSNAGSLLGLLSYPLLVEPRSSTARQAAGWSVLYMCAAVLCGLAAFLAGREASSIPPEEVAPRPNWTTQLLWLALAACGSALLLSITNHISQNIAAVPFLWVTPLSLYLLTFILCFASGSTYRRGLFLRLLGLALGGMAYALWPSFSALPLRVLIPLFCAGLFVCCMVCHGELARLKPHPTRLTSFYLMVSLGGAMGAVFVALLAPHLFSGYYELPIAMGGCAVLVLITLYRDWDGVVSSGQGVRRVALALVVCLITSLYLATREQSANTRLMVRNFYGVLRVADLVGPSTVLVKGQVQLPLDSDPHYRKLLNGTIDHGLQFTAPARRREPTTYYGPSSGIGITLTVAGAQGPLRVGVIGLGAGTIAAYGCPGDHYTFYEINPLVVQVANQEFSFLRDSKAKVDVVLGDARLSLEREPPQGFDVLAVDAFSSDAIPVHLLTREAFLLYRRHLKPGGVLAVHVSNTYLNLEPVVERAAVSLNQKAIVVDNVPDAKRGIIHAVWVLVGSPEGLLAQPQINVAEVPLDSRGNEPLWTDDYSSLLRILR